MDKTPFIFRTNIAVLTVGLLCFSSAVAAQETLQSVAEQLRQQYQQNEYETAYALALEHSDAFEGEPVFDLYWGLAAQASGHCNTGLYPLERVVQEQPGQLDARVALAMCYLQLHNYAAAKAEFSYLNQQSLPADYAAVVTQSLQLLALLEGQQEAGWQGYISAGVGYDSNPNNGIDEAYIELPLLGTVYISEEGQASSSAGYQVAAQASYQAPINQHAQWFAAFGANYSGFGDAVALPRANVSTTVGYIDRVYTLDISLAAFYRPLWLDNESYLDFYGVTASIAKPLASGHLIGTSLTLADLRYDQFDALSRHHLLATFWYEIPLFAGALRFNLKWGDEQTHEAEFDFNSRALTGARVQYKKQWNTQWSGVMSADYTRASHDSRNPLFADVREDKLLSLNAALQYRYSADWQLTADIGVVKNTSSLTLYDYTRSNVWLIARYQF